jgi:hypothetical protein
MYTMSPRLRFALLLLPALLAVGCGKKRNIAPEELGTPNTLPYEQMLYRDARLTFAQWLKVFSGETTPDQAYGMFTAETRRRLRDAGAPGTKEFAAWFQTQRHNAVPPFYYRFSSVDILDTDIRDTTKCIITATMAVDVQSQKIESVGSFTLVREKGAWRIPFAESGDWVRSWWQQERRFTSQLKDDGYSTYSASALDLTLLYPVSWDVTEAATFRVPNESQSQRGIEFSYVNPSTQRTEALVRVWTRQHDATSAVDTSRSGLQFIEKSDGGVKDATPTNGKIYVYEDPMRHRSVYVYAGVNQTETSYGNYAAVFTKIIESLSITE